MMEDNVHEALVLATDAIKTLTLALDVTQQSLKKSYNVIVIQVVALVIVAISIVAIKDVCYFFADYAYPSSTQEVSQEAVQQSGDVKQEVKQVIGGDNK